MIPPTPPRDTKSPVGSPISLSPSSSIGSSSPVRSTTPPPDYPFDKSIFAEIAPKRTSTSAAPPMTLATIKKLVVDRVVAALEAQAATIVNTDNTNRNTEHSETPCERTKLVFSHSNCTEDSKVKFSTSTLTEDALSWWNSFTQPIGIEEVYKITWSELKRLLTKKYYPRTEVKKMEDEFYNLIINRNDLKNYFRRNKELAVLCPNMVGHQSRNSRNKGPATGSNLQPVSVTCHACEEKGHYKYQCPKANNNAHGRTYLLRVKNAHQDLNVVTAQVMEKKSDERRLEDIPVVREFPKKFPKDLPGLPLVHQVEFQIDLMPGAAPMARTPYL
ncbi:reverse transcriptase domain-containing protein [Tanacetum coccineum]